jgi:hypothetical protein
VPNELQWSRALEPLRIRVKRHDLELGAMFSTHDQSMGSRGHNLGGFSGSAYFQFERLGSFSTFPINPDANEISTDAIMAARNPPV